MQISSKTQHSILRRMAYSLSENKQYLLSPFGEIGRFSCIWEVFPIITILSRQNGGRGLSN